MPKAFLTPKHKAFLRAVGADIRSIRLSLDKSQEDVGKRFGWNKDAISKIERGVNNLTLHDFLALMDWCAEGAPGHPALDLAKRYGLGE